MLEHHGVRRYVNDRRLDLHAAWLSFRIGFTYRSDFNLLPFGSVTPLSQEWITNAVKLAGAGGCQRIRYAKPGIKISSAIILLVKKYRKLLKQKGFFVSINQKSAFGSDCQRYGNVEAIILEKCRIHKKGKKIKQLRKEMVS